MTTAPTTQSLGVQLRRYLLQEAPKLARTLRKEWRSMGDLVTPKDLAAMVSDGAAPARLLNDLAEAYAQWNLDHLTPALEGAIKTGAGRVRGFDGIEVLDPAQVAAWIEDDGLRLVTGLTQRQTESIKALMTYHTTTQPLGSASMAKLLQPMLGLTGGQTAAVLRRREALLADGKTKAQADRAANLYASRLQKQRAVLVARTELAAAHNNGVDMSIQAAQADGLLGTLTKEWLTQTTGACKICIPLNGKTAPMGKDFAGGFYLPPAHPGCRCVVLYNA